jgi:hypothetical protein
MLQTLNLVPSERCLSEKMNHHQKPLHLLSFHFHVLNFEFHTKR